MQRPARRGGGRLRGLGLRDLGLRSGDRRGSRLLRLGDARGRRLAGGRHRQVERRPGGLDRHPGGRLVGGGDRGAGDRHGVRLREDRGDRRDRCQAGDARLLRHGGRRDGCDGQLDRGGLRFCGDHGHGPGRQVGDGLHRDGLDELHGLRNRRHRSVRRGKATEPSAAAYTA